jgi:hypothetical protein
MRSIVALAVLAMTIRADAADQCVNLTVHFTPTDSLQTVVWITKDDPPAYTYVDTLYITAKTGHFGMGNRPGRMDFNSGPPPNPAAGITEMWPYGRRINTFPVWAHKHGHTFPLVVFQDGFDDNLSHQFTQSSLERMPPYCRPISRDGNPQCWNMTDMMIWDTGSCATQVYTDKGVLSPTQTSKYPPRADVVRDPSRDHASVDMFAQLNVFDAVSRATPAGGTPQEVSWPLPQAMGSGNYVIWVETSKSWDFNATYNETSYPPPNVSYSSCGLPSRGQPSVVYKVPITVTNDTVIASTTDYAGYGDPDGQSGAVRDPDSTITVDTPGSGALRMQLVSDNGMYRVRVVAKPQNDFEVPGMASAFEATEVTADTAKLSFVEPGDDGAIGKVSGYEIRMRTSNELTADNFADSTLVTTGITPIAPGTVGTFDLIGLLPETEYWVGIRAYDDCHNYGSVAIVHLATPERIAGEVDACFVATAAYGSVLASEVGMLRQVRDTMLARTVLGELAIETYYTFGPAMAGVVGQSDVLRATARELIEPIIAFVRRLAY